MKRSMKGCPLCPLLFNIGLEMLAIAVRKRDEINPLAKVQEKEYKMAQYADDFYFHNHSIKFHKTNIWDNFTGVWYDIRIYD